MATLNDVLEQARSLPIDDRRRMIERLSSELDKHDDRFAVIAKELGAVPSVDAVFARRDELGLMQIYTIVRESEDATYDEIIRAERKLDRKFPDEVFSYHIWAHQGRAPSSVAPADLTPIFVR